MPRAASCSSKHKPSLTLMEMPENGPVHEYGAPVFKSANPCIVKPVTSLNKNEKWFSPDGNLSNNSEVSQKMPKKKKVTSTKARSGNSPSAQSCGKTRSRRYAKLDFVEGGSAYSSDDNKENIKPGHKHVPISQATSSKAEKTKTSNSKTCFAERSHRTNLI